MCLCITPVFACYVDSVLLQQAQLGELGGAAQATAAEDVAAAVAAESASGALSEETEVLQAQVSELQRSLRCSVCSSAQKDSIITKCFHMFCRYVNTCVCI